MKKNAGFGVVGIVLVVAAVAVLGLIGWRVYDANNAKNNSSTNQTGSNQSSNTQGDTPQNRQSDPNAGYVVVKEWGIRFKPVDGLSGVAYSIGQVQDSNGTASFSTESLAQYGDSCSASQTGMAPLGRLVRTLGTKDDAVTRSTAYSAQIGDYYYQYVTPQTICSDNTATTNLQTQTLSLFKAAIKSLESAK